MIRPKVLLLTAWIMVGFLLTGLLRQWFWPPHPHITHLHTLTTIVGILIRIAALICIFYYVQGRNWARIAVLVTSVVEILNLLQLRHEDTLGRVISAAAALLAVFFLYWLNTRSVRQFFTRSAATIEVPSSPEPGS
jgi:hypothetical protein